MQLQFAFYAVTRQLVAAETLIKQRSLHHRVRTEIHRHVIGLVVHDEYHPSALSVLYLYELVQRLVDDNAEAALVHRIHFSVRIGSFMKNDGIRAIAGPTLNDKFNPLVRSRREALRPSRHCKDEGKQYNNNPFPVFHNDCFHTKIICAVLVYNGCFYFVSLFLLLPQR